MLITDATVAWVMRATGCSEDDARLCLAAHADVRESERLNRVVAALLGMREARAQKSRSDAARARRAQDRRLADWRDHYSPDEAAAADPIAEAQARAKAEAAAKEAREKAILDGIARMMEARRIGEERHAAARAERVRRMAASTAEEVPEEAEERADWVRDLVQKVVAEVLQRLWAEDGRIIQQHRAAQEEAAKAEALKEAAAREWEDRRVAMVQEQTGRDPLCARGVLEEYGWDVASAVAYLRGEVVVPAVVQPAADWGLGG